MAILNNNHTSRHYSKHAAVGLGIVVALHNSNFPTAGEILAKYTLVGALPSPRSDPIHVQRTSSEQVKSEHNEEDEESFTYVTRHKSQVRRRILNPPVFKVEQEAEEQICRSDFLESCDLCRKPLLGKDIYMYRGEKAFCSEECRQKLIASDERKEKMCRSEAWKSSPSEMFSRSPCYYERGQIFSTGIVAI